MLVEVGVNHCACERSTVAAYTPAVSSSHQKPFGIITWMREKHDYSCINNYTWVNENSTGFM